MKRSALWPWIRMFSLTVLGSAIFSLGFDLFMQPHQINIGGVSGVVLWI